MRIIFPLLRSLARQNIKNVSTTDFVLDSLTTHDLQLAAHETQGELIMVAILTEYQFELFIFDASEPNKVFTSNQPIPDPRATNFDMNSVQYYSDLLVNRTLSLYANGYYYELPEKATEFEDIVQAQPGVDVIIEAETRGLASKKKPGLVGNDFYISPALGGMIATGSDGESWMTYTFSLQFGARIMKNMFLEGGIDHFSYSAFFLGLKYLIPSKSSIRFTFGVGGAMIIKRHQWEGVTTGDRIDPTPLRQQHGTYLVPNASILYMLGDMQLKLQAKTFIGSSGKMILTITPGIIVAF